MSARCARAYAGVLTACLLLAVPWRADGATLAELGERAVAGDVRAMVELGLAYRDSGVPRSATDWFCAAAERDDGDGLYWCGRSLLRGFGRPEDAVAGRNMLARAVDRGSAPAAMLLAREASPATAADWYERAARLGEPEGDYRLGLLFERRGRKEEAAAAFARAADREYPPALNALGLAALNAPERTPARLAEAKSLLLRASGLGDQSARFNLGALLLDEDREAAFRLLTLAMAGENAEISLAAEARRASVEKALGRAKVGELLSGLRAEIEATRAAARRRTAVQD